MIGPQRLSLLDGEVLRRRQYAARDVLDQVLDKIVDAFDFQIDSKLATSNKVTAPKNIGKAYASFNDKLDPSSPPRPLNKSWSFPTLKKQSMTVLINEVLCAWILNASPDGEKVNPLELGWSTRKETIQDNYDLVFHASELDELPLECGYIRMTC